MGIDIPNLPSGVEIEIGDCELNEDDKSVKISMSIMRGDEMIDLYDEDSIVIYGSDHVEAAAEVAVPAGENAAASAHVAYDFSKEFHNIPHLVASSKTLEQIHSELQSKVISYESPTLESLGVHIHGLSEGVTATANFAVDEHGDAIIGEDHSIGIDITLAKGSDHATERHFLVPHVQEQVMTSPDPDVAGMVPMAPPIG